LRTQVTSKGGTTERGIAVLSEAGVGAALVRAVKAATDRARELGDVLGRDG
jgi:pyrroline-5-carboxylate reductase